MEKADRYRNGRFLALLLAGLCAGPAQGGEETVSESEFLGEMPVVLTASRLAQPLDEAPAAVTVIDRQMIRDSGAWDLSEVFRLVPGMVVSYHSTRAYTMDSTVSYHGLSDPYARYMQVLIDGRSVYSPLYGGVLWSDLPVALDDIERIEVTRGPNAASYGANSFMGVINIITRHSADSQGTRVSLSTGRSREEALARYGGRNGDLSYRMTAGFRNDQGEDQIMQQPLSTVDHWNENKHDDKKIHLFTLRADYLLDAVSELGFQFGYNGGARQEGDAGNQYPFWRTTDNHFAQLNWRRTLDRGGELSVQYYHSYESSYGTYTDNTGSTNMDVIAQRQDLEVQHTFVPTRDTRLVWGGSVREDTVYAPAFHYPDFPQSAQFDKFKTQSFRLSRLFGNLEWRADPQLVFNVGAMAEDNSYTGTDISPRVAANWHFLPGHTLRMSRSQATRTPTDYEKVRADPFLALGLVKQKLRPERVDSQEIGYLGKISGLSVDFRVFRDAFNDLIVENGTSVANGNLNPGSATVKGFETQLKWDIGPGTRLIYALSHGKVSSPDQDKQTYTNSMPTNNQSLMLTHRFDHAWSASLMGYQVGEVHFPETDSGPSDNPQYFVSTSRRWDGRVAYRFLEGKENGELALIVQNLADAQYFEFRHDNQLPGRSAWLNLTLEY